MKNKLLKEIQNSIREELEKNGDILILTKVSGGSFYAYTPKPTDVGSLYIYEFRMDDFIEISFKEIRNEDWEGFDNIDMSTYRPERHCFDWVIKPKVTGLMKKWILNLMMI